MSARGNAPPAPDAVRVWRGFRAPDMELDDFFSRLGAVFIPATVEMQILAGLYAYLPSVPAGLQDKPDTVPDETAILFWDSQQTYRDGFKTLAVRTYTLTHAAVYTPMSRADFPLRFAGELAPNQPYWLVDEAADWMAGTVQHLVGSRPPDRTPENFRAELASALAGGADEETGAIACAGDDYFAYWSLDGAGDTATSLADLCAWSHLTSARPLGLEHGMWDQWPGLTITSGEALNMQFRRRWER